VNSSSVLAKLKALVASNAPLGVALDIPGSLLIFAEESREAVTASFERDDKVLGLSSGDLRVKFFLPTPEALELEDAIGNRPETVVIPFRGGKLHLWKR
jgi:hypothetical protein